MYHRMGSLTELLMRRAVLSPTVFTEESGRVLWIAGNWRELRVVEELGFLI
jgi:hypothetical protein